MVVSIQSKGMRVAHWHTVCQGGVRDKRRTMLIRAADELHHACALRAWAGLLYKNVVVPASILHLAASPVTLQDIAIGSLQLLWPTLTSPLTIRVVGVRVFVQQKLMPQVRWPLARRMLVWLRCPASIPLPALCTCVHRSRSRKVLGRALLAASYGFSTRCCGKDRLPATQDGTLGGEVG
jgi:hypothetical protein